MEEGGCIGWPRAADHELEHRIEEAPAGERREPATALLVANARHVVRDDADRGLPRRLARLDRCCGDFCG